MTLTMSVYVFFVVAAVLLVAFLAYRRTTPSLTPRFRVLLTGLRVLSLLLIVFLVIDPRYTLRSERTEPATIVTLIDRSESMSLPSDGWGGESGPTRFEKAREIARVVRKTVESKGAVSGEAYFSGGDLEASTDTILAEGQGTDIRAALKSALERYEGRNVTGFVVVSDGVDTEDRLIRPAAPPLPVYTVGVGDTSAPEDVRVREVDYNSVVRVPSRSSITAALEYSGDPSTGVGKAKRVRIRLKEKDQIVFDRDTLFTSSQRRITEEIPVDFREPGRRHFLLDVAVEGYDAEPENNRREIVIDAQKAGEKILIVDMTPTWDLHFLTRFLEQDPSFDFDIVSTVAEHPAVGRGKVILQKDFDRKLGEFDALVFASLDQGFVGGLDAPSIAKLIREDGKGMLVLPGPRGLFEQPVAWGRLSDLLPVKARPPVGFNLHYTTLRPGPQAVLHPITSQLVPLLSQTEWQQRSPLLGCYMPLIPKPGAEVLLETVETRAPAFICHETGGGRVAVLAAGPLWRWKFLSEDPSIYDDLMSRTFDYLCRGRDTERFVLRSAKNVYDSGEPVALTAEVFDEKMHPVTGAPVRVEVSRVDEKGDVPLDVLSMERKGSDNTRFKTSLPTLGPGRYRVRGEADLPDRTISSEPLDIAVSDVSVEFQRVQQDRENLEMIARQSRGLYVDEQSIDQLAERIDTSTRIVPTTREVTLRTSLAVFAVILGLLSIEWIVRKRVGMI